MPHNKSALPRKYNPAKFIIILAIAWVLMQIILSAKPLGIAQINSISPGTKILELQFNYSPETAHKTLEQLGDAGRKAYSNFNLIDFIYIAVYVSFFVFCIKALVSFFKFDKSVISKIWILPIFGGMLDIVENIFNLVQIATFPNVRYYFYSLSNWITMCKWVVSLGYEAVIVIGFLGYLFCLVKNKISRKNKDLEGCPQGNE